jgi:hypothetical protein
MHSNGSEMTKAMMTARALLGALLGLALCTGAPAQTPPAAPADAKAAPARAAEAADPLGQLSWLEGCWRGSVNKREFREHWLPLRGDLLVGISHTVMDGKTLDYEYLRLEKRADGVHYVTAPSGQKETAFKLVDVTTAEGGDTVFAFANPAQDFPQRISYRRSSEGWLYATVDGKVAGADRQVIYPMRRIGCETGEFIKK